MLLLLKPRWRRSLDSLGICVGDREGWYFRGDFRSHCKLVRTKLRIIQLFAGRERHAVRRGNF